MYTKMFILCLIFNSIENGVTKLAPDFIHPCKVDNRTCLIQSTTDAIPKFAKGLPEFGVPSLDPFHIDKLAVPLPGGLKVSFNNCKVTGIKKALINNVEFNLKKRKIIVEYYANMTLKGAYEATGSILALPINGMGDARIKIYNLKTKVTINTQIAPDYNGIHHLNFNNYKFDFTFGDKGTYNLTNLFKGNQELSTAVLAVVNDNWRLVSEEFGLPVMEYFTGQAVKAVEKFFIAVPIEELIDGHIPSTN